MSFFFGDVQLSLFVEAAEVAGVKDPVSEYRRRFRRALVIALHHAGRRLDQDLAVLGKGDRVVGADLHGIGVPCTCGDAPAGSRRPVAEADAKAHRSAAAPSSCAGPVSPAPTSTSFGQDWSAGAAAGSPAAAGRRTPPSARRRRSRRRNGAPRARAPRQRRSSGPTRARTRSRTHGPGAAGTEAYPPAAAGAWLPHSRRWRRATAR